METWNVTGRGLRAGEDEGETVKRAEEVSIRLFLLAGRLKE